MILKWRQILREDRKWIDYLIGYSEDNPNKLASHQQLLTEAKRRLKDKNTIRIIIENGEL